MNSTGTATCTNRLDMLINTRPCNELFNIADGKSSVCTAMGDMPVLAKDSTGKLFRFVLMDVRYVPDFKYTLIAVKQIWKEHRIDSLFADVNKLVFPSGESVPFDARFRLPVITLVSEPLILEWFAGRNRDADRERNFHQCNVGFHNIKSVAHIARLPAAQAGELMHRRCHLGVNKIRALPHVTGDAPKILASAVPGSCVHCAAAQERTWPHRSSPLPRTMDDVVSTESSDRGRWTTYRLPAHGARQAGSSVSARLSGCPRGADQDKQLFFHFIPYTTHYTHTHPLITPHTPHCSRFRVATILVQCTRVPVRVNVFNKLTSGQITF